MSLRFYEISEIRHRIQNPYTDEKLMMLGDICQLKPGMQQLDLGCGKGEMLGRWSQKYGISGTGVDISEAFLSAARQRAEELGVSDKLTFVQSDAAEYPVERQQFDIVSCIGATWIGGGTIGTLELMRKALKESPQSLLLVGEIYWREEPTDEACQTLELERNYVANGLGGLLERFNSLDLELVEMIQASAEEWDRYEGKKWMTAYQWLLDNPTDPDAAEFGQWMADNKRSYLNYERRYLGWGVFALKLKY
jgi:SAM-dependent methyltransferase